MSTNTAPTPANNGNTNPTPLHEQTAIVSLWDLNNTHGTLQGLVTALDDINNALFLMQKDSINPVCKASLVRLAQSMAEQYIEIAYAEMEEVKQLMTDTRGNV